MSTGFIKQRRSARSYLSHPVNTAVVRDILDCGRLAPTARNVQPWLLGAVMDTEVRHRISDIAEYGKFIRESPVCFTVFCLVEEKYWLEDGCAATMNMILAAAAHGLSTCWVAGAKKDYGESIRELLHVPDGYNLVSLIACGYTEEEPKTPKKELGEVTFIDRYGS